MIDIGDTNVSNFFSKNSFQARALLIYDQNQPTCKNSFIKSQFTTFLSRLFYICLDLRLGTRLCKEEKYF